MAPLLFRYYEKILMKEYSEICILVLLKKTRLKLAFVFFDDERWRRQLVLTVGNRKVGHGGGVSGGMVGVSE